MVSALFIPSGQSHSTCKAMVGQTPVTRCTWPASLNFSSVVAAAAGCKNLPKRVPVLANPHDGTSIRNVSRARNIVAVWDEFMATLYPREITHPLAVWSRTLRLEGAYFALRKVADCAAATFSFISWMCINQG